jgi:succinate dehydrogenase/fumarate reductase flavoprotein subunit
VRHAQHLHPQSARKFDRFAGSGDVVGAWAAGEEAVVTDAVEAIHPGTRDLRRFIETGYLFEGGTVADLTAKIGTDGETLTRTIERYNQYSESGVDEEFGRGTSELNRFNGDLANKPNPCLRKMGPGPYYAVAVWPSDLASSAGLRTDSRGRVLRSDGRHFQRTLCCRH